MAKDLEVRKEREKEQVQFIRPFCFICEEDAGVITLKLEMPGVTRDRLEIDVGSNELHITGERAESAAEGTYLIRERRIGTYQKTCGDR